MDTVRLAIRAELSARRNAREIMSIASSKDRLPSDVRHSIAVDIPGEEVITALATGVPEHLRDPLRVTPRYHRGLWDSIPKRPTGQGSILYVREGMPRVNRIPGASLVESNFEEALIRVPLRSIGLWGRVPMELLEDYEALSDSITRRGMEGVRAEADRLIMTGTGVDPDPQGFLHAGVPIEYMDFAGHGIDHSFTATRAILEHARLARDKCLLEGGRLADTWVRSPAIARALDFRNRSSEYAYEPDPTTTWGMTPVLTQHGVVQTIPSYVPMLNTMAVVALIGDFTQCEIRVRQGIQIDFATSGSDFSELTTSFRVFVRVAFIIHRLSSFRTIVPGAPPQMP